MELAINVDNAATMRLSAMPKSTSMDSHWHQRVGATQDRTATKAITTTITTKVLTTQQQKVISTNL